MAVFPYLGSYSSVDRTSYRRIVNEYADNSFRSYAKSLVKHRVFEMPFQRVSKTKRDAIESFFNSNWNTTFYIYLWPEASAVDLTGTATTGRHTARFGADPEIAFTNESTCAYSTSLTFILLD